MSSMTHPIRPNNPPVRNKASNAGSFFCLRPWSITKAKSTVPIRAIVIIMSLVKFTEMGLKGLEVDIC